MGTRPSTWGIDPRATRTTLLALAIVFVATIAPANASAASKAVNGSIGTPGSGFSVGAGELSGSGALAVNHATGDIYVVDNPLRIQRFAADGAWELLWGKDAIRSGAPADTGTGPEVCTDVSECNDQRASGSLGGEFSDPEGIAIDQADGSVYVVDEANNRLDKFNADGAFIHSVGYGVGADNEAQLLTFSPDPGIDMGNSSFTLTFDGQTTDPIAMDDGNDLVAKVRDALAALPNVGAAEELIATNRGSGGTFGPVEIEFVRGMGNQDQPELEVDASAMSSFPGFDPPAIEATTLREGSVDPSPDKCTVASDCVRGLIGGAGGQLDDPTAVEVAPPGSPDAGNVLVVDSGNQRVQEFDPEGDFLRAFGWDVVAGNAEEGFELCAVAAECKAGSEGSGVGQLSPHDGFPAAVAIDSAGAVYVAEEWNNERVQRFEPGTLEPSLFAPAIFTGGSALRPLDIEVGAADNLLVSLNGGSGGSEAPAPVRELTPAGEPAADDPHHQTCASAACNFDGLALDPGADLLYGTAENRIYVLGAPMEDPALSGFEVSAIGQTSAHLSAEVDPNGPDTPVGIPTSYRFEQRKAGAPTWSAVAPFAELGDGTDPIAVEADLTLEAGSDYEARLVAQKPFSPSGTVIAGPEAFSTPGGPPEAIAAPAAQVSSEAATLLGWVSPANTPTTYRFEWGLDETYGNSVPVPDGDAGAENDFVAVVEALDGLQPETTYHYRLVAENSFGEVASPDRTFATTDGSPPAPGAQRAFEMVTPPFKSTRAAVAPGGAPGYNALPGTPTADGEAIGWSSPFFPLTDDVRAPLASDERVIRRHEDGWRHATLNTLPLIAATPDYVRLDFSAASADLGTFAMFLKGGVPEKRLLPSEGAYPNYYYARRQGTGAAGYSPFLTNPEQQVIDVGFSVGGPSAAIGTVQERAALINDAGSAILRTGPYRGVGGPADPSDEQQLHGEAGGATVYLQADPDPDLAPAATPELVNECTGTGAERTELPSRVGAGASTDTIGPRPCGQGEVTSAKGAVAGGEAEGDSALKSTAATALSDDGRRVYFQSPDGSGSIAPAACTAATGSATDCPPQLFVRSYDAAGENPVVRWVSRSRSVPDGEGGFTGPQIAGQRIGLFGGPAVFEGASRDGDVVYFRSRAPLTPDDPNGTGTPGPKTTGTASTSSWDLFRYELPEGPGADPDEGTLTRISGGPDGSADPGTNEASGVGSSLRFHSEDGSRAYFVTSSPIAGADAVPPAGGATLPGGEPANEATRNLYLFDETKEGAERYRFVARIPYFRSSSTGPAAQLQAQCASASAIPGPAQLGGQAGSQSEGSIYPSPVNSCLRGTPDAAQIVFSSPGQLTVDDTDDAQDIYLYDAEADELVRVSAPPPGAVPYVCSNGSGSSDSSQATCNADQGLAPQLNFGGGYHSRQSVGWAAGRQANLVRGPSGELSVFFESRSELVPEDENGDHWDVYEWREGELSLISRGRPGHHSYFSGNSTDGEDVFVLTSDRIDPREIDDFDYDIYDARIGGGFPYTPPPAPCDVLAFACESEAIASAAVEPAGGSDRFAGAGNLQRRAARPSRCAKASRSARKASRRAKRLRGAARRARAPRAKRRQAKRARGAARSARRATRQAKRCRRVARGAGTGRRAAR